ncbi:MAG: hypothetical protein M1839_003689 [Geoglossum umbratile]|nr:MAG: hypothetical protein M1839_003689 [Geoglossum umbratile]
MSVSIFLVPSITFYARASVYRSYPQKESTSPARLFTTNPNRHHTPHTNIAEDSSDVLHGQGDGSTRGKCPGGAVQSTAPLRPQVERAAVRRCDSHIARADRKGVPGNWERAKGRAGGGAGKIGCCGAEQPCMEAEYRTGSKALAALVGRLDALYISGCFRQGHSFLHTVDRIVTLKSILDREPYGRGVLPWDQIVLRILDAAGPHAETNPRLLERVLNLAPNYELKTRVLHPQSKDQDNFIGVDQDPDHPAIIAELLFRLLGLYARAGNINASIQVWSRLQNLMDSVKLAVVKDFFARLKSCSSAEDEDEYLKRKPLHLPHIYYRIPVHVLADFLNLITENQEFEFGRWLLYSRDADGPVIPERIYSNAVLAPLLVNFAAATSDVELLSKVINNVSRPFSADMVRALLRREIGLRRWGGVEDILAFIRSHRRYYWTETELAELVVVFLKIERDSYSAVPKVDIPAKAAALSGAKTILSRLMGGDFGKPKPLRRIEKRFFGVDQYMDLLRYMVYTTLPSHADIQHDISDSWKSENTGYLTTNTFNTLLRGIVETQGSERGRRFWDLWCSSPQRSDTDANARIQLMPSSRYPVLELSDEHTMSEGSPRRLDTAQLALPNIAGKVQQMRRWGYGEGSKGIRPDVGTLRTIIQGALKERAGITGISEHSLLRKQDSPSTQRLIQEGRTSNVVIDDNLDSIFDWGKEMFRRLGLSEREIDAELGVSTDTC